MDWKALKTAVTDPEFYSRDIARHAYNAGVAAPAAAAGAPVDIATIALRPMGYALNPEDIVGSTEWNAKQLGKAIGRQADQEAWSFFAGELGSPDPMDFLKFGGLAGQALFHGSPWSRADKVPKGGKTDNILDLFDPEKIGTGEGAQAYGHGLYFAESPGVAKSYQSTIAGSAAGGKRQAAIDAINVLSGDIDIASAKSPDMVQTVIDQMPKNLIDEATSLKVSDIGVMPTETSAGRGFGDLVEDINSKTEIGHIYEVDIDDQTIAKMLDWDKPLSEQPEVFSKIKADFDKRLGDPDIVLLRMGVDESTTGGQFYEKMAGIGRNKEQASAALREAGIPGVRYLDQASRMNFWGGAGVKIDGKSVKNVDEALKRGIITEKEFDVLDNYEFQDFISSTTSEPSEWAASVGYAPDKKIAEDLAKRITPNVEGELTRNLVLFPGEEGAITRVTRDGEEVFKKQ